MTYTDAFLVEKLREILLRLYPTPKTSPVQEDHFAPTRVKLSPQEYSIIGENDTRLSDMNLTFNIGSGGGGSQILNENDVGIVHNYSSSEDDRRFADDSFIVGNYTLLKPSRDSGENSVLKSTNFKQGDYDATALTRNLQEFIQVLKMSLSPGSGNMNGGGGLSERDSGGHSDSFINDFNNANYERNSLSGVTVANSPEMEFNLTLDDIVDLNNLLDGSGTSLQFKHFLIIFLYFVIACVSIVGNLLVVQLVIRSRRLHTLTHALLANLAIADLFMATLNIPFSAARVILAEWPFGSVLCHLVPFVQVTSVYVTSITMAVIAIDRYSVIMNPLGTRMKSSQGVILVIGIWVLSGLLSLPYAIHHKVETVLTVRVVKRCQAEFGSIGPRRLLTVGTFMAQYLIPLLFTTVSYVSIMQRLGARSSGLGSTTPRQMAAQSRAKRKTIKMLVLTVVFFAVSWAPINIYHLLTHFSLVRHNSTAILVCHLIAMSSCTVNPFIYCWFNEHFRREALKWMRCFRTIPIVHPAVEINGVLTRADRVCHRAQSTSLIHTASIRRSPQLSNSQQFHRNNNCNGNQNHTDHLLAIGIGGPCTRMNHFSYSQGAVGAGDFGMIESSSSNRNTISTTGGYRPESLFLAKRNSLNDIFADHTEMETETEEAIRVQVQVSPTIRMIDSDVEEKSEEYSEKPVLFDKIDTISKIPASCGSCSIGPLQGICGSSSEDSNGDQV